MKLVILESGAKARTIKKYLGKGWIVDACNGHVQDLPVNSKAMWAYKSGELPKPPWDWTDNKAENKITKISNKAKKSGVEEVFIATDPDREGEFIAWRLKEILSDFKIVKRISFNEITKDAVMAAISEPRDVDMNLVEAAIVRRLTDRLVGWRCSRFCKSWKLKSMGRVQTPTLGFIVERELEREAHVPKEYNSVSVFSNGIELKGRFHESDDPNAWYDDRGKHHPERTSDTELARTTADTINKIRSLTLSECKESTVSRRPKAPFTTDTLLQTASSTLGWSISKTSGIASTLYNSGHITYIRTDSTRTNISAREGIRKHIEEKFGKKYLGEGVGESGKKKDNVQDAHEAIRPSNPITEIAGDSEDEKALYTLIWSRFAASQMSNSIRERRSLRFDSDELDVPFTGTSSWRIHDGWESVFSWNIHDVAEKPPKIGFAEGESWATEGDAEITVDFTKPIRRYSESSIIQEMKKSGIGRPSTYVSMVKNLENRKYIEKDGSSLMPTNPGRTLWLEVAPFYDQSDDYSGLFTSDFTSRMESDLDIIESGSISAPQKWAEFESLFRNIHEIALKKRKEKPTLRQKEYLARILSQMSDEQRSDITRNRELDDLSGDDVKEILDGLSDSAKNSIGPSEKQIATILKLVDRLNIDMGQFLKDRGESDITKLTGGRGGSASTAIGALIELDKNSPATERQVSTIISMTDSLEMPIEDAIASVNCDSIETISKSDASVLIGNLKKTINSTKRRGKK